MPAGSIDPELTEQLFAIQRSRERAALAAAAGRRRNGVHLIVIGLFMGALVLQMGGALAPVAGMAGPICLAYFAIWGARLRGSARRHWKRTSLVAVGAGLTFYVAAAVISILRSTFGLSIVGSSLTFWMPVAVLSALPPVGVGLWEARPGRFDGGHPGPGSGG